jgi:hypothetical protein
MIYNNPYYSSSSGQQLISNKALMATVAAGDPTDGDGSLVITVAYILKT